MDFEIKVIKRVQAGDNQAFAYLVKRYERPLFVFAGNLLRRSHRVEDLVQETFLAAFEHIRRYDSRRGRFSSWLYRIARNKCLNEIKKKREQLNPDIAESAAGTDVERDVLHREMFRRLDETLDQLPFEQRVVFVLAEIQGLPYGEIGRIEGIPMGTVKSRLSRARKKIMRILGDFEV